MENDSLYLQPELNLQELAQYLQTNPALLSAAINQVFGKNFNEYINGLRIDEFVRKYNADSNHRFTLLSHAMDSGFNSKATFNRAFKKIKGKSPQEFLNSQWLKGNDSQKNINFFRDRWIMNKNKRKLFTSQLPPALAFGCKNEKRNLGFSQRVE